MKTQLARFTVRRSARSGFTMMEMMLVLAIIAILIGIGVVTMEGVVDDAEIQKAHADMNNIEMSLIRYKTNKRTLPTQGEGIEVLIQAGSALGGTALLKPEGIKDPWGNTYQYRNPGRKNVGSYDIYSVGKDGQEGTADDIWRK